MILAALDLYPPVAHQSYTIIDRLGLDVPIKKSQAKIETASQNVIEKLTHWYEEKIPLNLRRKIAFVGPLSGKVVQLVDLVTKVASTFIALFRDSVLAGQEFLNSIKMPEMIPFAKGSRMFSIISFPKAVYGTISASIAFFKTCGKENIKPKPLGMKGLKVLEGLGGVVGSVENVFAGSMAIAEIARPLTDSSALQAITSVFDKIPANTMASISVTLGVVSAILSLATIAIQSKLLHDGVQLRKRVVENFAAPSDFLKEMKSLTGKKLLKAFGVSQGEELKARLGAIFKRNNVAESQKTMEALKNRLTVKNWSHALKITIAVVSLVATAVLMFTALAPLGFSLLAVGCVLSIAVMIMDYVAERKLMVTLKKLVPDSSSEMWDYQKRVYQKQFQKDVAFRTWEPDRLKLKPAAV